MHNAQIFKLFTCTVLRNAQCSYFQTIYLYTIEQCTMLIFSNYLPVLYILQCMYNICETFSKCSCDALGLGREDWQSSVRSADWPQQEGRRGQPPGIGQASCSQFFGSKIMLMSALQSRIRPDLKYLEKEKL